MKSTNTKEAMNPIQRLTIRKAFRILLGCAVFAVLLTGCHKMNSKSVSSNPKDLDTLTFNSGGWSYDGERDLYYCNFSYAASYEDPKNSMTVSVPAGYLEAEEKDDGKYNVAVAENGRKNVYVAGAAPVLFYIGDMNVDSYLAEGAITVGMQEGSSAIDVQMAVRNIKYNAHDNKKVFPGSAKACFLLGGSTMALAGVSSDDESSQGLMKDYGAVMKYDNGKSVSDSALGVIVESSAVSSSVSNAAEAWMYAYKNGDLNQGVLEAADSYGNYLNGLELINESEEKLSLKENDEGHLLEGSYTGYLEYILSQMEGAADMTYEHDADYFPEKLDYGYKLKDPTEAMYYLTGDRQEDYSASVANNWQIGVPIDKPGEMLTAINLYVALTKHEDAKVGLLPYTGDSGLNSDMVCAYIRTATATGMEK